MEQYFIYSKQNSLAKMVPLPSMVSLKWFHLGHFLVLRPLQQVSSKNVDFPELIKLDMMESKTRVYVASTNAKGLNKEI